MAHPKETIWSILRNWQFQTSKNSATVKTLTCQICVLQLRPTTKSHDNNHIADLNIFRKCDEHFAQNTSLTPSPWTSSLATGCRTAWPRWLCHCQWGTDLVSTIISAKSFLNQHSNGITWNTSIFVVIWENCSSCLHVPTKNNQQHGEQASERCKNAWKCLKTLFGKHHWTKNVAPWIWTTCYDCRCAAIKRDFLQKHKTQNNVKQQMQTRVKCNMETKKRNTSWNNKHTCEMSTTICNFPMG